MSEVQFAEISKEVEWDSGHRVPSHNGMCRNLHGHRYRMRVTCTGKIIDDPGRPDDGMLVDFGDLKEIMNVRVKDYLDHYFIAHVGDVKVRNMFEGRDFDLVVFPYVPTAENIARWSFEQMHEIIKDRFQEDLELLSVEIWETPTSKAIYYG